MQQLRRICFGNALTRLGLLYWCKLFLQFPKCNLPILSTSQHLTKLQHSLFAPQQLWKCFKHRFSFSSQDFKCVLKFCFTLYENMAKMKEGDVQTFLSSCLGDCLIGLCLNTEFSSYSLLLQERENKEV